MVEQYNLDAVFKALSDPTRRDILQRIGNRSMSIGDIARHYQFSFAGVAKHLDVLEHAGLVHKTRQGREQIVTINRAGFAKANSYLEAHLQLRKRRFGALSMYLRLPNRKELSQPHNFVNSLTAKNAGSRHSKKLL